MCRHLKVRIRSQWWWLWHLKWRNNKTKQNEQMKKSKQKKTPWNHSSRVCGEDTCGEVQVTHGLLRSGGPGSSPRIVQAVAPWKLCLLFQEFAVGIVVSYLHEKQCQCLLQAMGPPRGTGGGVSVADNDHLCLSPGITYMLTRQSFSLCV